MVRQTIGVTTFTFSLMSLFGATVLAQAQIAVIVVPPTTYGNNYHQAVLGNNSGSTNYTIDGLHLKRVSGSQQIRQSSFRPIVVGGSGELAPTGAGSYVSTLGALNWSGSRSLNYINASDLSTSINHFQSDRLVLATSAQTSVLFTDGSQNPQLPTPGAWQVGYRIYEGGVWKVEYSGKVCTAHWGDANLDGIVNSRDQDLCAEYLGWSGEEFSYDEPSWLHCDFDGDQTVTSTEVDSATTYNGYQCSGDGTWN